MTTYYTSDLHLCHANVIQYCGRPFATVEAMNTALIERWSARVKPHDDVWVLGDVAYRNEPGEVASLFERLQGHKRLVVGNHDNAEVIALPWRETPVALAEITDRAAGQTSRVVLCHYPMRSWHRYGRGSLHLYGHVHGRLPDYQNCCDVGVDRWDYRPVTLDETMRRMASAAPNPTYSTP